MSAPVPITARTVVLQNHVTSDQPLDLSFSSSGTFAIKDLPIPTPIPEDSILVQALYFSNDAGMRMMLTKDIKYQREDLVTLPPGSPFPSYIALGRVMKVGRNEGKIKVGDIVEARYTYWADYIIVPKANAKVRKPIPGVSLSAYLGALGPSGGTVYWALHGVLKPKATDTLIVSAAAGALGCVAVQYAKKVLGVKRVIGIAGTDEKCKWIKTLGADEAVNYKSPTFARDLKEATPEKADLFLDIVAGSIMDEVMMRMKPHGIICLMGAMAMMEKFDEPVAFKNFQQILINRLTVKGFTLNDYLDRLGEAEQALTEAAVAGKLVVDGEVETVIDINGQMEQTPIVWNGLFTGANKGKLITKVAN